MTASKSASAKSSFATRGVHVPALDPNADIRRIQANRLVQIGERSVALAFRAISVRPLGIVFRKAGLQADDLAEIRDRFIILALREEDPSAALIGERLVAGIDAGRIQRARTELDALLEPLLLLRIGTGGEIADAAGDGGRLKSATINNEMATARTAPTTQSTLGPGSLHGPPPIER